MKIIEKIEISHFRSFSKNVTIHECNDLNVISGRNDSGKSNILKALNLFFTETKVDFYNDLFFDNDFSKIREKIVTSDQIKGKKIFKIRILFNRHKFSKSVLTDKFWVEKVWDKDGHVTRKTKDKSGRILKHNDSTVKVDSSTTSFLKKIHFLYIPAIKDARFFNYLKNEYQLSLGSTTSRLTQQSTKKRTLDDWREILTAGDITNLLSAKINTEASEMMKHFLSNAKEVTESSFIIPELDFSKVLDVKTENNIPLSSRGDGVQTKFIPQILNEISRNNNADLIIWGFEEPENSFEYHNAQLLADKFKKEYSKDKQIFLTTHSFNFISLGGENVSLYRVWKDNYDEGTEVKFLKRDSKGLFTFDDEDQEILERELGIVSLNQDLEKLYLKKEDERKKIQSIKKELSERLKEIDKPILFVEDKYDQIYKIAWLKINGIECNRENFDILFTKKAPFIIHKAEGAAGLEGFLRATNVDFWNNKKIIGLFDFDEGGVGSFKAVKRSWKTEISGDLKTGIYLNRHPGNCFCSMLIPIPDRLSHLANLEFPSFVEIENLLTDAFLITSNKFAEIKKTTGNTDFLSIKTNKKSKIWTKLFELEILDFKDFEPLFSKVEKIFNE